VHEPLFSASLGNKPSLKEKLKTTVYGNCVGYINVNAYVSKEKVLMRSCSTLSHALRDGITAF